MALKLFAAGALSAQRKLSPMIHRAHWNILTECNLSCGFCYLWRRPGAQIWSTPQAFEFIDALSGNVTELVFGGGDPLMRPDILDLIVRAKLNGLAVEMHTNAALVDRVDCDAIFQKLDRLGLSLDGAEDDTHDKIRSAPGNFRQNVKALEIADRYRVPTTVRSLCTARNAAGLAGVAHVIRNFECVDKWSIRQFVPLGRGAKSRRAFELSDSAFAEKAASIVNSASSSDAKFRINVVSAQDMEDCFCLIAEDGVFYGHPSNGRYDAIGKYPEEHVEAIMARLTYHKPEKRNSRGLRVWPTALQSSSGTH